MASIQKRITAYIEREDVRTITLDIFDTVLMRNVWPEDVQFLRVAELWLPHVHETISSDITAYKLYSWRQYARDELFRAHYELCDAKERSGEYDVNVGLWFGHLVDLLADTHQVSLAKTQRAQLVEQMIAIEIETEKANLSPNDTLIEAVRQVKATHPDVKVYFLSDMYLRRDEIMSLLEHFAIDIFDDGSSSTEEQHTKHSGGLYHHVHNTQLFGASFDLFNNLHIGDSAHSDSKMAHLAGSHAMHYHPYRFRRLRTRVGAVRLMLQQRAARKRDKKLLQRTLDGGGHYTAQRVWQRFGALFSQPLYSFLMHVGTVARQSPETTFLMVSSEATMFQRLGRKVFPHLFSAQNITIAPKLNRRMMLRALVWFIATNRDKDFNASAIVRTICLGEISGSRRETYEFFFGEHFPYSELVLNRRSEEEFTEAFLADIDTADELYTQELRRSYEYVCSLLPSEDGSMVIVDVGWGGTVQVLLSQFAKLHGVKGEIKGLYLGVHPFDRFGIQAPKAVGYLLPNVLDSDNRSLWNAIIWEYAYTNKPQFPEDDARLAHIQTGFAGGEALFRRIEHNPKVYFDQLIAPRIRRLISHPTRREIETIGSIRFDRGFVDEREFHIVDMRYSQLGLWRRLIRHPRSTLRATVLTPNAWAIGYIRYYRMYGIRTLLRLAGKVKGARYL